MSPAAILLEHLTDARGRGTSFEAAWPDALAAALQAAHPPERREWAEALKGTVESWSSAWLRRTPARAELALVLVADRDEGLPAERTCQLCDEPIPPERRAAKYCCDRCRRLASRQPRVAA
jgi:hypothetical protein